MQEQQLRNTLESILLAADKPLSSKQLLDFFVDEETPPNKNELVAAIETLANEWQGRSAELVEVASGYRLQIKQIFEPWVSKLWDEKPPRYSRALLETLALIAYRQPITRAEIEDIRGVAVSSHIIKTMQERDWIQVLGHKDTPGKPAMYGTTRQFLDYFNLNSLDKLPTLAELKDLEKLHPELDLAEAAKVEETADEGMENHEAVPDLENAEVLVSNDAAPEGEQEAVNN